MGIESEAAEQLVEAELNAIDGAVKIVAECVKESAKEVKPSVRQALQDIKKARQSKVELPKPIMKNKGGISR